ncbi:peptidoglycan DD-metalloendopeptidase family protein [Ruminococcaceae bacterium OttesenSCG-928-L11]|nr:peptidoglycan DD-metalloendopeptidase family protein [Ruminococcaceae bacterium OttesenSCG-928-L11]
MRDERLSAREKKTHKMSRDGLVERNQSTGEEQRVSQRGQDFQLRRGEPEQQSFFIRDTLDWHSRRQHRPPDSPDTAQPGASDIAPDTTGADDVPSIPEQAPGGSERGQHAHASPGETLSHKQRGTAYQRRFTQNPPAPEQPASKAPGNGPERPHAAPMPDRSGGTPNPESAPNRGDTPPSRLQFDKAARTQDRHSHDSQHSSRYAQRFLPDQPDVAANSAPPSGAQQTSPAAEPPAKPAAPKLQFAADEKPPDPPGQKLADRKLAQATHRAERVSGKLDQAREKLPARRRPAIKKEVNPDSGKVQRRLRFEKEIKTQRQHVKGPRPLRPVKAAGNAAVGYAHKKLYQAEEENVGTKAAHRTEMAAEGALRSTYRLHKTRPYRRVQRLQQKSVKMNARAAYQQALRDNLPDGLRPRLRSNLFSRMAQKRRIKRQYAKAARDAKRAGGAVKQAGNVLSKAFHSVASVVRRHPVAVGAVALLLLMMMVISGIFTSCASMASGGMSAFLTASYTAPDADIDGAEVTYREWEADLQFQIDNAETDYPDFDEYLYSVDDIGHDPYLLMAYLTAKYGDFTLADVEADLREIFSEQYTLTFAPESETRYADPGDSDKDGDREPYIWRTLHIILTARPFAEVIGDRLNDEQKEHQDLLMDSGGNRQYAGSPFPFDWRPYISCYYGWRVNPVTGLKDNHQAVDIAVARSTPILAAHDGTVTISTLHDAYGYYIALDDGNGLVTKYAHCDQLLVGVGHEVKQGDVIALVGSTGDSTGPHLHYEVIKDGTYLNPLYFAHSGE